MEPNYSNSAITRSTTVIQQSFAWMFGGLMVSAVTSLAAASDPSFQRTLITNPILMIVLIVAELGLVFFISAGMQRMSHGTAIGAFLLYSALTGVTFSWIFLAYQGGTLFGAFLATSLIFGVMAIYGFVTKADLSSIGSIAIMAVVGLIIASLVNVFLHSSGLAMLLSYATVAIFCALTAYDTQKLKVLSTRIQGDNLGIYGALSLYLDFINIFFALLRIFGGSRNN